MSEPSNGIYEKYVVVKRVDGTTITDCFVLVPEKDPAAMIAIQAYAAATDNERLADDLYKWVGKPMRKPLTLTQANSYQYAVWIEFRHFPEASGWQVGLWNALKWADRVYRGIRKAPIFGVHYRIWEYRPTDEEREAAPWEDYE